MIIPILLALQTSAAPAVDQRPIRIWMDASGPVTRGRGVRVYVQAGEAGNLVVLHSRSDGRIEVLFPARPTDDPHITAGTYEVRGQGDGPVWTVSEPDGDGLILAALSPDPIWFNEFSHDASWNPGALTPSWSGADPTGGMADIVQRMLGDGGFTYDVLRYTVVAPTLAQSQDSVVPDSTAVVAVQPCEAPSPVACQPMLQPRALRGFGRGVGRGGLRHPGALASASAPTPAVAAPLVLPIVRTPFASVPIRPLRPRPVAGAVPHQLAGASPGARSALALRYVRPAAASVAVAVAPRVATVSARQTSGLRVSAAQAVRAPAVALMSRPVRESGATPFRIGAVPAPRAAARAAPATSGTQSHGTRAGWLVLGGRGRGR